MALLLNFNRVPTEHPTELNTIPIIPIIPEIPVNSSNPKSHRNPNNSRNPNNLSNHNEDHHQEAAPPPAVHHLEEELDRLTGKIVSFKRLFLNSEKNLGNSCVFQRCPKSPN